jgi:transposase-like protein
MQKDTLIKLVSEAHSYLEVLRKLGLTKSGGNYGTLKKYIKRYGVSTSPFKKSWNEGKTYYTDQRIKESVKKVAHSDEDIFVENCLLGIKSSRIKKRLVALGREYRCEGCGLKDEWVGKNLVLHLDHINGDKYNNSFDNLRFLCPNCHSQTKTYCGRNTNKNSTLCQICKSEKSYMDHPKYCTSCYSLGKQYERINTIALRGAKILEVSQIPKKGVKTPKAFLTQYCSWCKKRVSSRTKSNTCQECCSKQRRLVDRPSQKELITIIEELGYLRTGKKFGVSDNAIRKWVKAYGLDPQQFKKKRKEYSCLDCRTQISAGNKRCQSCANTEIWKTRRKNKSV